MGYPYVMYSGRIDTHKGCEELLEYFIRYKQEHKGAIHLVLTGKDEIGLKRYPDVEFLGTVPEEEKLRLMAGAAAFLMPSPNESLSIVTLEAMAQSTPILVNGRSEVLRQHSLKSGGGLFYSDYESFASGLSGLLNDKMTSANMGQCGRRYVLDRYSHERLKKALVEMVNRTSWCESRTAVQRQVGM
jgi:glycosyltransferase involved in cell wall biosynthesis